MSQKQIDSEIKDIYNLLADVNRVRRKVVCEQTNEWILRQLKDVKHHLGSLNDVCKWMDDYIRATAEC